MTEPSKAHDGAANAAPLIDQDLDQVVGGGAKIATTTTNDLFLKIDGIDGESSDDRHKG